MSCPNRSPGSHGEWICTCMPGIPDARLRDGMSRFINGWLGQHGHARAKSLASDPEATVEQMRELLKELEEDANHAYGMWRQTT